MSLSTVACGTAAEIGPQMMVLHRAQQWDTPIEDLKERWPRRELAVRAAFPPRRHTAIHIASIEPPSNELTPIRYRNLSPHSAIFMFSLFIALSVKQQVALSIVVITRES